MKYIGTTNWQNSQSRRTNSLWKYYLEGLPIEDDSDRMLLAHLIDARSMSESALPHEGKNYLQHTPRFNHKRGKYASKFFKNYYRNMKIFTEHKAIMPGKNGINAIAP